MAVSRIFGIYVSSERIAVCEERDDFEYRRGICRSCAIEAHRVFLAVGCDIGSRACRSAIADHGNDEVFEILEVAVVGEIDFVGKHAFHGIQEFLEFILIS